MVETSQKETDSNYKTITLNVAGMHCEGCVQNIQRSLSKINGLNSVQADFNNGEVRMRVDESKVSLEKIRGAIRKVGFIAGGVEHIGG